MALRRVKRYPRQVVKAVTSEPWIIRPEKMEQIIEFLSMRASGHVLSEEEISERVAGNYSDRDVVQVIDDKIAVIDVFGVLAPRLDIMTRISGGTSLGTLAKSISETARNSSIKTAILRVDSPGGTYVGTPEVREAIQKMKDAGIRVVTSASNEFASGAFWIGTSAQEVYATTSTYTGSVGVYSVHQNDRASAEKEGTKFFVATAGKHKANLHPMVEWTKEDMAVQQGRIDVIYDQFVSAVAENRSVSKSVVIEQFGEGSIVFGDEAKERGMIDGVASFDEVLARERDRLSSSSSSSVSFVSDKDYETMKVSAKVKAALFARGLIKTIEASDEVCEAILVTFASVANVEAIADKSDDEILALIMGPAPKKPSGDKPEVVIEPDVIPPTNAEVEHMSDTITAIGRNFPHVTSDLILTAISENINDGKSIESIVREWTELAADEEPDVSIVSGPAAVDKFNDTAIAAILASSGGTQNLASLVEEQDAVAAHAIRHADMVELGKRWMVVSGNVDNRRLDNMSREEIAESFLSYGGGGRMTRLPDLVGGSANFSGDHPHLVDQLANKILWKRYPIAAYKFQQWCAKLDDVKDFDPVHFVEAGLFEGMDLFTEDSEDAKELKFRSDLKSWYNVDRFRNKVGLSVEMVVGDKVGGFLRQLESLAQLPMKTMNTMAIHLLNQNPTLPDGLPLFSAGHNNLVTAPGSPSSTQAQNMVNMHMLQLGYDSEEMDVPPSKSLHPVAHSEAAKQTFMRAKYDQKVAQTDATINTVRDEIDPIIDARFDRYSVNKWYTFIDPQMSPVIGYAFRKGFGFAGKREVEYCIKTTKRFYYLESDFGVACVGYRGMVMNPGI